MPRHRAAGLREDVAESRPRSAHHHQVLSAPRSLPDLTPAWLSGALRGAFPGTVVDRAEVVQAQAGTNLRATLALHYVRGRGPARVFVKMQGTSLHRLMLVALRALTTEARLAGSGTVLPLEHPRPYAGAFQPARLRAIVVMEDVTTRGGRPNDASTPLGVEAAGSGLEGLARLHAAHWDRPLPAPLHFVRPWRLGAVWAPVSRANLSRGLRRLRREGHGGLVPAAVDARVLERQFRASARLAATGPQTLLHGDPHPGNTYALPGPVTGFYDWQLIRTGNWSHDVGYFLISSLEVEARRAHERDLLRLYLDALDRAGAPPPDFGAAWERYRAAAAFGLATWLHTYAFGGLQPDPVCLAMLERFAAAYGDLGTGTAPGLLAAGG